MDTEEHRVAEHEEQIQACPRGSPDEPDCYFGVPLQDNRRPAFNRQLKLYCVVKKHV